ncbi:unnamed protein product (macronuclear) [Paramecium tetraurelia]|uniref:Cyclin-like domain-containing protein n=1 Tax=Paramecium tetraurelia TaxID=5888 RepID=A0E531_PARTE|nr:uncharacterized protein GSPATT00023575001 [Paramecium tetraurelia]CAK90398.1 unnamed protein product [Paramecium tetraurelia]|eukprot:XP_001457795.1 hypothetical protein (macronuclear) [Paramecium tetraurelia strain d4-2]
MHNYYEQVDFLNGGKVAHQQEVRYQDQDQLPQETEKTLKILDQELAVDEEYKEAFEIARRLLKFYKSENAIRNGQYFAGAALYFGFRCKNAPYLLIEISEFIKKDSATKVAKCYLKLLKFVKADAKAPQIVQLAKSLQYLDPSIYIPKFVRLLEISRDKYKAIVDTAMKLIKRMMLDWMAYGRRPSSLCGAALLISARFHGENVPTSQVCKTVQVCDETIRKRLAEFNQTGLSQLTREQFEQIENIETGIPGPVNDPPSYRRIKQQEEEMRKGLTEEQIKQLEESTLKKALEMIELLKVQPEVFKQEDNLKQEYPIPVKEPIKEQKDNEILSSLSEIDEQEYILNEQEKANKQIVWSALNKEYIYDIELKNQKKKAQQEKNLLSGNKQQTQKARKQAKVEKSFPTPQESVAKNYENDGINPQAVKNLFSKEEAFFAQLS